MDLAGGRFRARLPRAGPEAFLSRGHGGGRFRGTVYASPGAAGAPPRSPLPTGTLLVMEHVERDGSPGPVFAMRKLPAGSDPGARDWTFGVLAAAGERVLRSGRLPDCVACHRLADADAVFGLAASPR